MSKAYKEPKIKVCRECHKLIKNTKIKKYFCSNECSIQFHKRYQSQLNKEFGKLNDKMYNNLTEEDKDKYLEECRKRIMSEEE